MEALGIDIYIFELNGKAKKAVAFHEMRLSWVSRIERVRFIG
jgi:hypothetical protein